MTLSLSLCGVESGTLLLASGTAPSSRAAPLPVLFPLPTTHLDTKNVLFRDGVLLVMVWPGSESQGRGVSLTHLGKV